MNGYPTGISKRTLDNHVFKEALIELWNSGSLGKIRTRYEDYLSGRLHKGERY